MKVGAGVIADETLLRTVRAGVTRQTRNGKIWTEGRSERQAHAASLPVIISLLMGVLSLAVHGTMMLHTFCRYTPCVGDNVVGMVIERHSDTLIVDIGGPFPAVLNSLAFEGATRRNRPKVAEGDLVYARVTLAHKDLDTELCCTEVSGKVCLHHLLSCCIAAGVRMLSPDAMQAILAGQWQRLSVLIAGGRLWTAQERAINQLQLRPCTQLAGSPPRYCAVSAGRISAI